MYLISVFPCWSVIFPIYGRKYSMKVKLFMENMWEFSLCFHFVTYKVNIPMYAGEFFYVIYLFHTKLIFLWMQGDLNKSNVRNIFVGYKWKFTFQTKPLWGFATVYSSYGKESSICMLCKHPYSYLQIMRRDRRAPQISGDIKGAATRDYNK